LEEVIRQYSPEAVANLAAETHVDRSILSPAEFVGTNFLGTLNVLEAARRHDLRYLHVSTDEVYGESAPTRGLTPQPLLPIRSLKGLSGPNGEGLCEDIRLHAFIVRPSTTSGPGSTQRSSSPRSS